MKWLALALPALMAGEAHAEQRVVELYQQYTFEWADYGNRPRTGCEDYIRDALELINIQRPFCTFGDVGGFLNAGWRIQHSEEIRYQVKPTPKMERWECRLFRVDCIGKRYYLAPDREYQPPPPSSPQLKHIRVPKASAEGTAEVGAN